MKQVFLSGGGQVQVFDVPIPGRRRDAVLVRNAYSLISAGTEGAAVTRRSGVLGVIEKARGSKDRVEQVWRMAQTQGVAQTWELVQNKLKDFNPIGYSSAGVVVETDHADLPFAPGDRVACMGTGLANHAEYAAMPRNMVAAVPAGVPLEQAAFGAVACIAMQGIRRLELGPGETVGVIGLGLIGQLAVRLLVAMGYRAVGMDLDGERAALAAAVGGVEAWAADEADAAERVAALTAGRGLDGVLLCAATDSDQPVNLAFDLCRRRGRVSVVGDVGLGLDRAKMYKKELELRMSTSYGPGRYDPDYELGGHDYPVGYVRWTEQRNLEHFLELLGRGRLDLAPLITATVGVDEAPAGYAKLKDPDLKALGVVLDYGLPADAVAAYDPADRTRRLDGGGRGATASAPAAKPVAGRPVRLGLVGVGGFAKAVHLPNIKQLKQAFELYAMASRSGGTAGVAARLHGAKLATSDHRELLADPAVDAVLISTRHAAHAGLILDALDAGKHVFVEKPMTTTVADAEAVCAKAAETGLVVRVGFNRRFSPALGELRRAVGGSGRRMFTCRVNVGPVAGDWSNTVEEGGRLLGEGCHFFDLCNWFIGMEPRSVQAAFAGDPDATNPDAAVTLTYPDGSVGQVVYTTLGSKAMPKESFEAFGNGRSARCDNYEDVEVFGGRGGLSRRQRGDKGHRAELAEFAAAIRGEGYRVAGADARAGLLATWAAVAARTAAAEGGAQEPPPSDR